MMSVYLRVFTRLSHQNGYKVASCINCTNITPSGAQLLTTGRKDNAWGLDVGDWRNLGALELDKTVSLYIAEKWGRGC